VSLVIILFYFSIASYFGKPTIIEYWLCELISLILSLINLLFLFNDGAEMVVTTIAI
jgi:hypothetical protein